MLAIKFKGSNVFEEEWHVGERNPIGTHSFQDIDLIQADGHELQHITAQYHDVVNNTYTIPIANVRVMRWCGSIAQTIIANLCS
jgi:hypothetical protein